MTDSHGTDESWTVLGRGDDSCDDSGDCDDCDDHDRRQFLVAGAAGVATLSLAGCIGDDYEDEYEQTQAELEEAETTISGLEDELADAESDLEEKERNHVVTAQTYVGDGEVPGNIQQFVRENAPQSVFVQGMTLRFEVGVFAANTGEPVDAVDSAVVEIPDVGVTLDLEWDSETETWQATWDDTADAEPGVYTYTVDVTLDGTVNRLGTREYQFELLEYVGQTYDVEFQDPGDNVSGLDGSATIEVSESTELLIAGEEQGWNLPYNCRVGRCGRCVAKTDADVEEVVEMTTNEVLPDHLIEDGYTLTCTGQPRDDFAIETDVYNEVRDEL